MVFHLVKDAVRREYRSYVFTCLQIGLFSGNFGWNGPYLNPLSISMFASMLTSATTQSDFNLQLVEQLPIPRRTLWRSQWWFGTIVPAAITVLASTIGLFAHTGGRIDVAFSVMSFVYCVLYTGLAVSFLATNLGRRWNQPISPDEPMGRVVITEGPFFLAFVAVPFLLSPYLPRTWSEITVGWVVALLAVSAVVAWGFAYEPPVEPRRSRRTGGPTASTPISERHSWVDRLTGLTLIIWQDAQKRLTSNVTVLGTAILFWWIIVPGHIPWLKLTLPVPALAESLRSFGLLPFASLVPQLGEPFPLGFILFITLAFDFGDSTSIRGMRPLPLSAAQLAAFLTSFGALTAAMLWIPLVVLHLFVADRFPVTPRLDLFLAVGAVVAMAQSATRLVASGSVVGQGYTRAIAIAMASTVWVAIYWLPRDYIIAALYAFGLTGLALSFAVNHWAITSSARVYVRQLGFVRLGS